MTYESSFLQELEITSKKDLIDYAAAQLPEDQIIVWFRAKEPVAMIAAKEIAITVLDKKANLASVLRAGQGARVADLNKAKLVCSIYPMHLISASMAELEAIDALDTREFTSPPNTLQFKGWYSSKVGSTDEVFMLCVEAGPFGLPVETDRLTWKSSTFGPARRPLYETSELWQISIVDSETMKVVAALLDKPVGSCIAKAQAAEISIYSSVTRYFQKRPSAADVSKLSRRYVRTASDKLMVLYRAVGVNGYELQDAVQFEL